MSILGAVGSALAGSAINALTGKLSKQKQSESQSGSYSGWSDTVQNAVEGKFLQGLNLLDYAASNDLANLLYQRANDYDIDVDAIVNEARRKAEIESGSNYQRLARQAGSDANSLVALAQNEALLDRESNLASLRAQLEMQEQEGGLNALATALDANNQTNNTILNLGNLLKGAQSNQTQIGKNTGSNWGLSQTWQDSLQGSFNTPVASRK